MNAYRTIACTALVASVGVVLPCLAQSTTVVRRPTAITRAPTAAIRAETTQVRTSRPPVVSTQIPVPAPVARPATTPAVSAPVNVVRAPSSATAAAASSVVPTRTSSDAARNVSRTSAAADFGVSATTGSRAAQDTGRTRASGSATTRVTQDTGGASASSAKRRTFSGARLRVLLGRTTTPLRVVRATGVTDVVAGQQQVSVAPSEFVFRKLSDTARRITRVPVVTRPVPGMTPTPTPAPTDPTTSPATPAPADSATTPATPVGSPDSPVPAPAPIGKPQMDADTAITFAMPYRWLSIDSLGKEHVLIPYFIVLGGGLTYDVVLRRYRGTALVGVEDSLATETGSFVLARPVRMQLVATTSGGRVAPAQLAIAHTSLHYDSVNIDSPESTYVRIRTSADPTGIVIPIRTLDMAVTLTPDSIAMDGFGLASADVSLALPRGMARSDSAMVNFESGGPSVRPARVNVTGASGGHVRVRSSLPGTHTVKAYLDGVAVGQMVVTSKWPVTFLAATFGGTLLGGLARWVSAKRRKKVRALPWDVARGAPFGIIVAIGSAVGLDLLNLKLEEPGALPAIVVLAAIGAWAGTRVFDRSGSAARTSPTSPTVPASPRAR